MTNQCVECSIFGSCNNSVRTHLILGILLCNDCKRKEKYETITPTRIKILYNINKSELADLRYTVIRNPMYRCSGNIYLYLKCEVLEILEKKRKNQLEQREKTLKERLEKLEKYKIIKKEIYPDFWDFIIGDYLDIDNNKPKRGILSIKKMTVASKKLIKSKQPPKKDLINHFVIYKKMKPKEITYNALISSGKKLEIFKEQCFNIASYLCNNDRNEWIKSYDAEYSRILSNITPFKIYAKIIKTLINRNSHMESFKIVNLLEKTYKKDFKTTYKYSFHPEYGIENTITKLQNFTINKNKSEFIMLRKKNLIERLKKYEFNYKFTYTNTDIVVPSRIINISSYIKSYVNAETLMSLEETIMLVRLTDFLLKYSTHVETEFMKTLKDKIKNLVFEKLLSWDDGYMKVISNGNLLKQLERYNYNNYDDDYDEDEETVNI
jgi:sulfur transfer protein SufE